MTFMCALASIFNYTILLAVPPSSRRHGFRAQSPRIGSRVWPQPLALVPSSPLFSVIPLSFPRYRLDDSVDGGVRCLVHTYPFWGLPVETGDEPQRDESFAVRLLALLRRVKSGLCSRLRADAWRLLCLSSYSSWSSPSNARAVYLVRCNSSQFMSLCIGLLARAGGLIALFVEFLHGSPTLAHV